MCYVLHMTCTAFPKPSSLSFFSPIVMVDQNMSEIPMPCHHDITRISVYKYQFVKPNFKT